MWKFVTLLESDYSDKKTMELVQMKLYLNIKKTRTVCLRTSLRVQFSASVHHAQAASVAHVEHPDLLVPHI